MRRNKLALCLYLVWTTDEQDASAPAPAGARPQARQGRFMEIEHLFRYPALVLDHTGLIGYSFFHTPLVE